MLVSTRRMTGGTRGHHNCGDPLMKSEPGSGFFDNCTCVNRYYNNGTRCKDCETDHFCVGGRQHACPAREWTNGLTRQEVCVCRPGFVREGESAPSRALRGRLLLRRKRRPAAPVSAQLARPVLRERV